MINRKVVYIQYARKSTEGEDRQALSIAGQLKDNLQVIERNNLNVIDTITDHASAAIPFNRHGYTDMIHRIKKGEASGIVVWHIDRLIRNPLEEGEFKWLLQTGIIKSIWTPGREYRSEDNALLFSIEASMAAQYSRDLSVKVKRGLKQQHEKGQPAGRAPLGYLNTKFQTHGTNYIIDDPNIFPILRKGVDLMLTGSYTVKEIGKILFQSYGLRGWNGLAISKNTLYRVFTNPLYYGYFTRTGTMYKGNYKPLLTIQEYDRIQQILGRDGKPRYKKHSFPFTGLMKCGSCGCAITASAKIKRIKSTGENKTYIFYHCTKRKKGAERCPERNYTTEDDLKRMIVKELQKFKIHPVFKEWALDYYRTHYQDEINKRNALAQAEQAREDKLLRELDNLLDLRISGAITEAKFNEKKNEKEQLLLRVKADKEAYAENGFDWLAIISGHLQFAIGSVEAFINGDEKTQKGICLQFGSNWTLKDKKLLIDKRKWLLPIENIQKITNYYLRPFELTTTVIKSDFNPLIEYLDFTMRRLRNDVRTQPL